MTKKATPKKPSQDDLKNQGTGLQATTDIVSSDPQDEKKVGEPTGVRSVDAFSEEELEALIKKKREENREQLKEDLKPFIDKPKEYTAKLLEAQPKVEITIPFDEGERLTKNRNGEIQRPMQYVSINGVAYYIPKGIPVKVPEDIHARLIDSMNNSLATAGMYNLNLNPGLDPRENYDGKQIDGVPIL